MSHQRSYFLMVTLLCDRDGDLLPLTVRDRVCVGETLAVRGTAADFEPLPLVLRDRLGNLLAVCERLALAVTGWIFAGGDFDGKRDDDLEAEGSGRGEGEMVPRTTSALSGDAAVRRLKISGVILRTICRFSLHVGCFKHPCSVKPGMRKSRRYMNLSVAAIPFTMAVRDGQNADVMYMGPQPMNSLVVAGNALRM